MEKAFNTLAHGQRWGRDALPKEGFGEGHAFIDFKLNIYKMADDSIEINEI